MDDVRIYRVRGEGRLPARSAPNTAICGLSGGVDSTVAALLVHKAIGDRLTCVFVDNGLLRKNEFESVLAEFRERLHLKVIGVDATRTVPFAAAGCRRSGTKAQDYRRRIYSRI